MHFDPFRSAFHAIAVDADDRLLARLLPERRLIGEIGDVLLEPAFLDQLDRAAALIDLPQDLENALLVFVGQRLDIVGAAERVDHLRNVGLVGDHLLRAQRKPHRVFRRDGEGFVIAVRMERLRAAEHG